MSDKHITTYLSDHLAGAAGAIELMQHVESVYANTDVARVIAGVRVDVEADVDKLKALAATLDVTESPSRELGAWVGARMAELKLYLDDSSNGPLYLLEAIETLAMGIDGKLALWRGLAAAADDVPSLRGPDYARLTQRAQDQRQRIEPARLDAVRAVFNPAL